MADADCNSLNGGERVPIESSTELERMLASVLRETLILQDRIVELCGDQKMLRDSLKQQQDGLKNVLTSKEMWLVIGHGLRAFCRDPDTWRAMARGSRNYVQRNAWLFGSIVSAISVTVAITWIAMTHRLDLLCGV